MVTFAKQNTLNLKSYEANGLPGAPCEKLLTIKEASAIVGVAVWKLRRAAKRKLFPSYRILNTRLLVKISEVIAAIDASRQGGDA